MHLDGAELHVAVALLEEADLGRVGIPGAVCHSQRLVSRHASLRGEGGVKYAPDPSAQGKPIVGVHLEDGVIDDEQ